MDENKRPTEKQLNFRKGRKEKGLKRARAFFNLMQIHKLNLPALDNYINAKDENGLPLHPDIDEIILPELTKTISRSRIHQILMRLPEYREQSSWESTRKNSENIDY